MHSSRVAGSVYVRAQARSNVATSTEPKESDKDEERVLEQEKKENM
jgi:hypothetical protein